MQHVAEMLFKRAVKLVDLQHAFVCSCLTIYSKRLEIRDVVHIFQIVPIPNPAMKSGIIGENSFRIEISTSLYMHLTRQIRTGHHIQIMLAVHVLNLQTYLTDWDQDNMLVMQATVMNNRDTQ